MNHFRVIPCLLMKEGGLYKTQQFKNPKYLGDPINISKIFNDKEVDELMILDISCSKARKGPDFELIRELASECFMPLCYGGGIRNFEDANRLFSIGIEKISLQTSAISNLNLISEIAKCFGSQSVVVSVDIKKNWLGKPSLYSASEESTLKRDWRLFLREIEEAGAGEILLTSVDREGTMRGMDLDLIREASRCLTIPLIAAGGIGNMGHIQEAKASGASAVGVGSYFVFHGDLRAVLITYPRQEELRALLS